MCRNASTWCRCHDLGNVAQDGILLCRRLAIGSGGGLTSRLAPPAVPRPDARRSSFGGLIPLAKLISEKPLTPSLSPSDGERVAEGGVRSSPISIRKFLLATV